jgi:hypothetical protein
VSGEDTRPHVQVIDDELDQWGRPRRQGPSPIDVMPEQAQAEARKQLEERGLAMPPSSASGVSGSSGSSSVEEEGA